MSAKTNVIMLIGAAVLSIGAFWILTSPGLTQDELFMTDLDGNPIEPLTCPSDQMGILVGQPIADVDLHTLPQPYEIHAADNDPAGGASPRRLLIEFNANGQVTDVSCG
jgi:hypothetical protein